MTRASVFLSKLWLKVSVFVLEALLRPERPAGMWRFGSYYGGWWIPEVAPERGVALCVGAGTDVTFDLELVRLGYETHCVDPTPAAVEYVRAHAPDLPLHPVGIWSETTTISFAQDQTWDESWAIGSAAVDPGHATVDLPVMTVGDLMAQIGADRLAILKLDIEGAEHRVLRQLLADGPRPHCLAVEFDDHRLREVLASHRRIVKAGYRLLQIEGLNHIYVQA